MAGLAGLVCRHSLTQTPEGNPVAKKTYTDLIDDIDGSEADKTITFSLEGATYEIDLSSSHIDELYTTLAPYLRAGRRQRGTRQQSQGSSNSRSDRVPTIRTWAREQGYDVSDRGRLPGAVYDAYNKAVRV